MAEPEHEPVGAEAGMIPHQRLPVHEDPLLDPTDDLGEDGPPPEGSVRPGGRATGPVSPGAVSTNAESH